MKSSIHKFLLVLDEPSKVFSQGDHVHGKIVLDVKKEIELWKLNLECCGEVYVSWPENSGTYTRYRFGREELFHVKDCVYGDTEGNEDIMKSTRSPSMLKPSVYSFSFDFTIPCIDLPSSFRAKHGYIRYWMQANIENKKGKSEFKTAECVFDIGGYVEYDEEELVEMTDYERKFQNAREIKKLRASCNSTTSSILSAHTNKILYHPGEVINTHVETDNEACRGAHTIEASLVRVTFYDDGKNNKTQSKQEVVHVEKEVKDYSGEDLEMIIPAKTLQPTMLRRCKCIKVTYYVQTGIKINGKPQKKTALLIPVAVVSSPVLPSTTSTTQSPSAYQKEDIRSINLITGSASTTQSCGSTSSTSVDVVCYTNTGYIVDDYSLHTYV